MMWKSFITIIKSLIEAILMKMKIRTIKTITQTLV